MSDNKQTAKAILSINLDSKLVASSEIGSREYDRLVAQSLRLHRLIDPKKAMNRSSLTDYFVSQEIDFEVGEQDWSRYELEDADGNHVYSAVGKFNEDDVYVFDRAERLIGMVEHYVPRTRLGLWRLTCSRAKSGSDYAQFVPTQAGTLFVKLSLEGIPKYFDSVDFRNSVGATIEAAFGRHALGSYVQGEGMTSLWFKVTDLELAAILIERTLDTYGLLGGASVMEVANQEQRMPRIFYPKDQRRVVTEWGC